MTTNQDRIAYKYTENQYEAIKKICVKLNVTRDQAEALGYCVAWTFFENRWDKEASMIANQCGLEVIELAALVSEKYFEKEYEEMKECAFISAYAD